MMTQPCFLFLFILLSIFSLAFNIFITMDVFKVGSLNLNGAGDTRKRAVIFEMNRIKHIDVLLIQETHSDGTIKGGILIAPRTRF